MRKEFFKDLSQSIVEAKSCFEHNNHKYVGMIVDKIYAESYYCADVYDEFTIEFHQTDNKLYCRRRIYLDEYPEQEELREG